MAIAYCEETKTFYLDGKGLTYAFFINQYGYAEHLYFGKTVAHDDLTYLRSFGGKDRLLVIPGVALPEDEDGYDRSYHFFPSELTFFGTGDYREPTVHIQTAQGDRLTELLYDGHEILKNKPKPEGMPAMRGGETLVVHLKDKLNGFSCDLYYTVYEDAGVVARRSVFKNRADEAVVLRRAYSFALTLPGTDYDAISLYGAWARERRIEKTPLHHGVFSVDSKRASSSATLNPFLGLMEKGTTEENGNVYGVNLVYSSSFVLKAESLTEGRTLVTGGIQDFDFSWKLEAGECFETPEAVLAYSHEGIGGMSRCYHDAYRKYLINPRFAHKARPVVLNTWEGSLYNFNTEKLKKLARGIAGTGVDTFVVDDGWFGKRNSERTSMGDWYVNEEKIPGGWAELTQYLHSMKMKFGLWFEPEVISEDSDLFRAHPDYAIGVPGRPRCVGRNQYMLDLTRKEVRDHVVEAVNSILRSNDIAYVKWDYNSNVTASYSLELEPERQTEFAHRYALGFYDLCERIVEANPDVFFEGCSSGGARFDPGVLYYFPQIWTSDDTDAEERTKIQYGTSVVYPLSAMSCHVSAVPNHQTGRTVLLQTRADVAHLGPTGYELDCSDFTDADREQIKKQVAEYRHMEKLLLDGDLYRTENPMEDNYFGFMVVSRDKEEATLTAYRRISGVNNAPKYLKIRGLDPNRKYYVAELDRILSGSTLMNAGIPAGFARADFATQKYHFRAI